MHPWYRNDRLKIVLMALAAGLVVGGIVTYAASLGSSEPKLAVSDASVAAAIASDQAQPTTVHARLTAEPPIKVKAKKKTKAKVKRAVKRSKRKAKRAPAAAKAAPKATPKPDSDVKAENETSASTPVAAAPRRQASQRVVAKNRSTITPQKRTTPKSTPAPTPSKPAPAVSTPAPTPAPTSAPAPTPRPGNGNGQRPGHGNGNGGDDDPGNND